MNLIQTIEADVSASWKWVEGEAEDLAKLAWRDFSTVVLALVPAQYAEVKTLVQRVMTDVGTGDIGDIEAALLNAAEAAGLAYVSGMGSPVLQAIIGVVKAL